MTDFIKTISTLYEIGVTSYLQQIVVCILYDKGEMSLSEIQENCKNITIHRATLDVLVDKGIIKKKNKESPFSVLKFYLCDDLKAEIDVELR